MTDPAIGETERCPQCDAEFVPAASPLGLCPACLLKLGASDPAMKPAPAEAEPACPEPACPEPVERVERVATTEPAVSPALPNRRVSRRGVMAIGAAAIVVAALGLVYVARRTVGVAPAVLSTAIRFTLPWPDETDAVEGAPFAVAPDGSRIALAARSPDGQTRLWVRTLQSIEWRALSRTEGAALPFWSPDSRQIGFFAERKLKKVDVSNGLTYTLCDASSGRGGTWNRQGTIVFALAAGGPLFRVPASGGTPEPVTTLDEPGGERAHAWPHFLPNGRSVLFVVTGSGQAGLHLVSLDAGQRKLVVAGGGAGAFAQGFLLFVRGTQLLAQRFDPDRGEFRGDQQPLSGGEDVGTSLGGSGFSVSDTGVLVHRSGGPVPSQLTWFDRTGRTIGVMADAADYQQFSISPDGRRVAVARRNAGDTTSSIWLLAFDRQLSSRLTRGPSDDRSPLWHPDGSRIAFVSRRAGREAVYVTDANGGGQEQLLHESPEPRQLEDVSSDGRYLVYSTASVRTGSDLWALPLDGDHKTRDQKSQPLFHSAFNESEGRLSPDGRWIAYVSDESDRDEVYVRPFPEADSRWQISTAGGHRPRWRHDGRELFFVSADGHLLAVEVSGPAFRSSEPRILFPLRPADEYEVRANGEQFLTKTRVEDRNRTALHVVINWTEELGRESARH